MVLIKGNIIIHGPIFKHMMKIKSQSMDQNEVSTTHQYALSTFVNTNTLNTKKLVSSHNHIYIVNL
jgi:hypothetical protein